jgi:hypothetical protein
MVDIFGYFDLNKRAERPVRRFTLPPGAGSGYERDIGPSPQEVPEPPPAPPRSKESTRPSSPTQLQITSQMPIWEQLMMYFGTVVGVLFSSAVMEFKSGEFETFSVTITSIILSAVIALVIIPVVFEKLNVKPDAPLVVRLGLFVQHGVFWQVLFGAMGKAFAAA